MPLAVVEVLKYYGINVIYPKQKCCGMPSTLENGRELTLRLVRVNMDILTEAVASWYASVCSCPTCGYMLATY
jgi:glycerol-3-phosphate dehydrogenase subunit C